MRRCLRYCSLDAIGYNIEIMKPISDRTRTALIWCIAVTLIVEAVTIIARCTSGTSAAEFQASHAIPMPFRIHHMFWGIVPVLASAFVWRKPKLSGAFIGFGLGVILSDAIHHCIVLPIWVGNMGWHWP